MTSEEKLRQIIIWLAELNYKQVTTVKVMAEIEQTRQKRLDAED